MVLAPERPNGVWVPALPDQGDAGMPRLDEVLSLYKENVEYFRAFHDKCRKVDMYDLGLNPVPAPQGFDPINPPTANAILSRATDHVDVKNLAIDVDPPSARARARAERIKKFLIGFWSAIKKPVLRTAVRHGNSYGISFLKPMWRGDKWPEAPVLEDFETEAEYGTAVEDFLDARGIAFPFDVVNVNPKNLVWDMSRIGMKWTIEFYEHQARDIKKSYPEWITQKDGQAPATWIEYWDEEWVGYIADNDWIWGPHRHGYGFNPYTQIIPAFSMDWDAGPPNIRYRGLLDPIFSILDAKARTITAYEAQLRQYAWRTLDFRGPTAQAESAAENYELFGSKNVLPPSVEVSISPNAVPPPELLQQLSLLDTEIETATFPNVVRGMRPRGVSAGFAISVLAGMGRLVFQGMADGLSRSIEEVNSKVLKLVENKAAGRVTVHARSEVHQFDQTIGADDIRGLVENRVVFKAEAPEEREREALLALRLWNGGEGVISLEEAQERSGIISPLDEQNKIAAERILRSETFRAAQEQMAAEGMGLLDQLGQAMDQGVPMGMDQGAPMGGGALGNQFLPGQAQLQRPGERNIQQGRVATQQGQPSVFPKGMGGMDALGSRIGAAPGGAQGMPSGQTVR